MIPEDMPKNEWVTMTCDSLDLKPQGITGRYHKMEIFKGTLKMKVDY